MVDAHHAPGWYLDGAGAYRWWDGDAWTDQTSERRPEPVRPAEYFIPDARYPSTDVAGESFRSSEIIAAIGREPELDEEIEYFGVAYLVPEPDNPHDRNAISVRMNGHVVGYIAKDEARDHLLAVQRVTASGHIVATQARIWCVRREHWEGGTRFHASVRVALPYDGIQLPQNEPPKVKYSVLPWGSAVQVSGEEQHFDAIRPFVVSEGRSLVVVTLHRSSKLLKNGQEREHVEVRIDDRRVGELSATTSRHFLPTIDHHTSTDTTVAAWARIEGSPLSAEVKVQGAKANELSSSWLDGAPETVGTLLPPAPSYRVPNAYIDQPKEQPVDGEGKRKKSSTEQPSQTLAEPKGGCAAVLILLIAVPASTAYLIAQLPYWG